MKLYRNAIILTVVVILLAVTYFTLGGKNDKVTSVKEKNSAIKVLELNLNDINEIDIENKGESLKISNKSGKWTLDEPKGLKYDQAVIDALPPSLLYFDANKVISNKEGHLEKYGLKEPCIISVRQRDGKVDKLEIGNSTSTGDNYYIKTGSSSTVYTVGADKAESFLLTRNKIKDKNVLALHDFKKIYNKIDEITGLTFEREGKKVFTAVRSGDDSWSITSPTVGKVDESGIRPILDSIVRVAAREFIEENPVDLERYGLKCPAYSLEFTTSDGRKKLLIGSEKVSGKEFFAKVEGSSDVFSLDEAGFNYLDKSLDEILDK